MTNAIYAGSFDPVQYGHLNIIERAAKMFGTIYVSIGSNYKKKNSRLIPLEERIALLQKATEQIPNVTVSSYEGMLAHYARKNNIITIIRGLRNAKDLTDESCLAEIHDNMELGLETIPLLTKKEFGSISSSIVKEIEEAKGNIHQYVPLYVKEAVERYKSKQYIVGLTGEIGCGKSHTGKKIEEIGKQKGISVHHIDIDKLAHKITSTDNTPWYRTIRSEIAQEFGADVQRTDSSIDRKKLGAVIFQDPAKARKLTEMMTPPMMVELQDQLLGKEGIILLEAALLAESKWTYLCNNNVVLVTADKQSQKRRLKNRDLDEKQIKRRLESQYSTQEKRQKIETIIQRDKQGKIWEVENSDNSPEENIISLFDTILNESQLYKK